MRWQVVLLYDAGGVLAAPVNIMVDSSPERVARGKYLYTSAAAGKQSVEPHPANLPAH